MNNPIYDEAKALGELHLYQRQKLLRRAIKVLEDNGTKPTLNEVGKLIRGQS